ncbi:MAG: DUF4157 domain-containing protein [Aureispira sp.]
MKDFQKQPESSQEEQQSSPQQSANKTGIPDNLKASIEYMSQVSLSDVRVYYNSNKPAELAAKGKIQKDGQIVQEAFAYTEGTNVYIAPGQEKHLAHELWHVVQQKLKQLSADQEVGGTKINTEISEEKEADQQGKKAQSLKTPQGIRSSELANLPVKNPVAQGVFNFQVNPETEMMENLDYKREKQTHFLTGNKHHKHTTADAVRDNLFSRIAQGNITEFAEGLALLSASYLAMPGLDLMEQHKSTPDSEEEIEETPSSSLGKRKRNEPIGLDPREKRSNLGGGNYIRKKADTSIAENYLKYNNSLHTLQDKCRALKEVLTKYKKEEKEASLLELVSMVKGTLTPLENFMDLMPLTNVVDPQRQKGSGEGALKEAITADDSGSEALWGFFDAAAITLVTKATTKEGLSKPLPWMDASKYDEETSLEDIKKDIAQKMLANHVNIMNMAYPEVVHRSQQEEEKKKQFGTKENIKAYLKEKKLEELNAYDDDDVVVTQQTKDFKEATVKEDTPTTLPELKNIGNQGPLSFNIDPNTYKIVDPIYRRNTQNSFLIGNKQGKHVTADSIRDNMWMRIATNKTLAEFARGAIDLATLYQNLPSVDLLDHHLLKNESEEEQEEHPLYPPYADFKLIKDNLVNVIADVTASLNGLENDATKQFQLLYHVQDLAAELETFMDLIPLVNLDSTIQNRGKEVEARKFLGKGKASGGIDSTNKALWAFFDRAAIDEFYTSQKNFLEKGNSSLPWLDHEEFLKNNKREVIFGKMIGNHIRIAEVAYKEQVDETREEEEVEEQFGTEANIKKYLYLLSEDDMVVTSDEYEEDSEDTLEPLTLNMKILLENAHPYSE